MYLFFLIYRISWDLKYNRIKGEQDWMASPRRLQIEELWKRYLDGYGMSDDRGIAVMVESSGAESNVTHSLEDSIKQIKNSTDFLSYLKSRYKNASVHTFTQLRTPTLLLMRNQLTLTVNSLDYSGKWL
jgi:hypothetical protein